MTVMDLVKTITVTGSSTSIVTFDNIPQDGIALRLYISTYHASSSLGVLKLNGVTSSLHGGIYAQSSSPGGNTSVPPFGYVKANGTPTGSEFTNTHVTITNYTSTSAKRGYQEVAFTGPSTSAGSAYYGMGTLQISTTAPVTSVSIDSGFVIPANSTFSLYVIRAGSNPSVTIS